MRWNATTCRSSVQLLDPASPLLRSVFSTIKWTDTINSAHHYLSLQTNVQIDALKFSIRLSGGLLILQFRISNVRQHSFPLEGHLSKTLPSIMLIIPFWWSSVSSTDLKISAFFGICAIFLTKHAQLLFIFTVRSDLSTWRPSLAKNLFQIFWKMRYWLK